jgi:hypothetical protein
LTVSLCHDWPILIVSLVAMTLAAKHLAVIERWLAGQAIWDNVIVFWDAHNALLAGLAMGPSVFLTPQPCLHLYLF